MGYLWTWAENQVLVAVKAVPLGQSAGQRALLAIGSKIAELAAQVDSGAAGTNGSDGTGANGRDDLSGEGYSNFSPGLAILSSRHETQYSRLFRS